jgi:hypothetical protein
LTKNSLGHILGDFTNSLRTGLWKFERYAFFAAAVVMQSDARVRHIARHGVSWLPQTGVQRSANVEIHVTDLQNVDILITNRQNVDILITEHQNVDILITNSQNVDIHVIDHQDVKIQYYQLSKC